GVVGRLSGHSEALRLSAALALLWIALPPILAASKISHQKRRTSMFDTAKVERGRASYNVRLAWTAHIVVAVAALHLGIHGSARAEHRVNVGNVAAKPGEAHGYVRNGKGEIQLDDRLFAREVARVLDRYGSVDIVMQ